MQKSITCLDEEQRTFCISYICSLYPVDPGSPPYHHESHVPLLQVFFFYIFIEHQHLDLGLTQLLQYTAKHSSYVSCFIKFKKDQYECTNNLWIVYSSKYNISSVALLYVIILIYKHFKLIYRYWNSSLLS